MILTSWTCGVFTKCASSANDSSQNRFLPAMIVLITSVFIILFILLNCVVSEVLSIKMTLSWEFPEGSVVRTLQGAEIRSLDGKWRSCMPPGVAKKKKKKERETFFSNIEYIFLEVIILSKNIEKIVVYLFLMLPLIKWWKL